MASKRKYSKVSYKNLLADVILNLQLPTPIYNHLEVSKKIAFVIVRIGSGAKGYYFQGKSSKTLAESEEDAAEKAVMFLAKQFRFQVEDVSMETKERLTSCSEFFKAMKEDLKGSSVGSESVMPKYGKQQAVGYQRPLSINFRELLDNILMELRIPATKTWRRKLKDGRGYVYCFSLRCLADEGRLEWFIGDACHTIEGAEQSLEKKAILFLKPLYKFEIKDISYSHMYFAEARYSVERDNYLALKEQIQSEEVAASTQIVVPADECSTPTDPEHLIPSSVVSPPPPMKPKALPIATAPSSSKNVVPIKDSLTSIYKALGLD